LVIAESNKEFTEGGNGPPTSFLLIRDFHRAEWGLGDRGYSQERWEHACQRPNVTRHQPLGSGVRPPKIPDKGIDGAIERLVWDRFALVATPGQHHGLARLTKHVEVVAYECRLAHPRTSVNRDDHWAGPLLDGREGIRQGVQLRLSTDEVNPRHRSRDCLSDTSITVGWAQTEQNFGTERTIPR
jgi:hypothetical protein